MKGFIFTEFLAMVELRYSVEMVDDIINDAQCASGGAYTATGHYQHEEMVALTRALSDRTGTPVPDLLINYGAHLFAVLASNNAYFLKGYTNAFDLLASVEDTIHAEVRKLYPEAELPRFKVERLANGRQLVLVYESARHLEDLAEGLMRGCAAHFGESLEIERRTIEAGQAHKEFFMLTLL